MTQFKSMLKYIIPFAAFLFIPSIIELFFGKKYPDHASYFGYAIMVIVAGALLIYYFKSYKEIVFKINFLDILVGVIIFIIWIGLEGFYTPLGSSEFNPYKIGTEALIIPVIVFRLLGAILIAPIIEELFTRSFLIRFFVDKDWEKVPIGKYTFFSFLITVLFFGLSHNRWLVGLITAVQLTLLLYRTKSIFSCITAHVVANLCLAIYVLATNSWTFW